MTIKGMESLIRKLDALGSDSHQAVKRGVEKATKLVQGDAKLLVPTREELGSTLKNSIQASEPIETKDGITGIVSTNVGYAAYVEFGTGQRGASSPSPPKADLNISYRHDWAGMVAQPYMYPALVQNKETIKEIIADSVRKEIKNLGG